MDAVLQAQGGHVALGLLEDRRAAADEHQVQLGPACHQRHDRVDQVLVAFRGAHARHAAHDDIVIRQGEFIAQGRTFDRRRQHDGRVDGGHLVGRHAALDQVFTHMITDRRDPVRQTGVGPHRSHLVRQMAGSHDQRGARQSGGQRCDDRIAPAVGVEHIEAPFLQDAAHGSHALQVIHRPVHVDLMHGKAGIRKAFDQQGPRLADGFDMVATRTHGRHFLEDPPFLTAKAGGGFRMHDTQFSHQ
ncbi:hypothetical protein G6F63_013892 [Rhizopus arrhizus]|nr:hypothetical protein G6F63_013892 [Rhizopus arrhizus]